MSETCLNGRAAALLCGFVLLACGGDDGPSSMRGPSSALNGFGGLSKPGTGSMGAKPGMMLAPMTAMSGAMCTMPANPTACDRCILSSCRTPCNTCAADSKCPAALECIAECSDDSCVETCGDSATIGKVATLANCLQDNCATECGATSDGPASSCDSCVQTQCSRAKDACSRNPACVELADCCSGTEAECEACLESAPSSAVTALTQFADCISACGCD